MRMKCPFRIIKTIKQMANNKIVRVINEYADCLEGECPYYGRQITRLDQRTMRWETVTEQGCRRVDNADGN